MRRKLTALTTAAALALTLSSTFTAAAAEKRSQYYNSATLLGLDEHGVQRGFSSVTDITGISAVTYTFRVDEKTAQKAAKGDIDFTGTLGTESDTFGRVSHEWSFAPYKLDESGEVVYDDDLMPVSDKELTMEKIMDGYYCITLENPTGFFKDNDTYARVWFDCDSDDYKISLTGVVLSFDDTNIVRDLSNARIEPTDAIYTGSACKPSAKVTYGKNTLKEGTDYTLSYKNNTNAGTATVTATGKGKYKGTVSGSFTVKPAAIVSANVAFTKLSFPYTGSKIKPAPTVKVGSKTLTAGTDYSVTYQNNTEVGTATVKIKGKGNYTAALTKTFTIVPKATTISSVSSPESGKAKVTWKKNTSGEGYQIVYSKNTGFSSSNKKVVNKNTATSATIGSLTKGSVYYFKVRAFKKVDGKYIYGAFSSVKTVRVGK